MRTNTMRPCVLAVLVLLCAAVTAAGNSAGNGAPAPGADIDTTSFAPLLPCLPESGAEILDYYRPRARQIEDRSPEFIFAVIGDSHITKGGFADTRYIKASHLSRGLLATYVKDISRHEPRVDIAIHLGDVTEGADPGEFTSARRALDSLSCRLYPVVGNHDNFKSDAKAAWLAFARRQSTTYTFDIVNLHFIVLDCTLDPYAPPYVDCDSTLRDWVARDLAQNFWKPTIVLSHFNMWERGWNAMFDTTLHYAEYRGMPELRRVLEDAGNVIAVINGHVHANRVEEHNGIYYVDVAATLIGPPSIRYFYVYPDRIQVRHEDISDGALAGVLAGLCEICCCCFAPGEVCSFIDGAVSDKDFTIPIGPGRSIPDNPETGPPGPISVQIKNRGFTDIKAAVASDLTGTVEISLHDVRGRRLDRGAVWKSGPTLEVDLVRALGEMGSLPPGIYFLRVSLRGKSATEKIALIP